MQRMTVALWAFLLVLIFSCKKNGTESEGGTNPTPVGIVTPVGTPDNQPAAQKTIGANGGMISSTDGRLKVTIPAGALATDREISIRSISNHNPLAIQQAYRIEPHDVQFSKPVTIEFSYTDEAVKNTVPEALGIAYQDNNQVWQAQGGTVLDKTNKTVKVTTTHFSDWSLFESFHLYISRPVINVNGTSQLEVFTAEDLIVPLVPGQESPIGKKVSMAATHVKQWSLAGAGNLHSNGPNATYRAPATVPGAPNPVAVSVTLDLRQRGQFLLVGHIEVTGDDGEIEIRVAGNGWLTKSASLAVRRPDGTYAIADSDGDVEGSYVLIQWTGGIGMHAYKSPFANTGTHVHYLRENANNYTCSYMNAAGELVASGGGVNITSMGDDDGFIKGTFTIEPAGYGDNLMSTTFIEGRFRVRKGWQ
jgi:hypothetical protein